MSVEPLVGFHVSAQESLELTFDRASELGCTTFQVFTRSPMMWRFKPLGSKLVASFREKRKQTDFRYIIDHMPYLPNLATSARLIKSKSRSTLLAELRRCDRLGIDYMVVHLGSHMGGGIMSGIRNVAGACRAALDRSSGRTVILLENMAGQKNCVGARFEELRAILDLIGRPGRAGVCFDTCHALAAGFEFNTEEGVAATMDLFDSLVGLKELRLVHMNDSKGGRGSGLDRHEHIGMGKIGSRGFRSLLAYRTILEKPIIMETPIDDLGGQLEDMQTFRKLLPRGNKS